VIRPLEANLPSAAVPAAPAFVTDPEAGAENCCSSSIIPAAAFALAPLVAIVRTIPPKAVSVRNLVLIARAPPLNSRSVCGAHLDPLSNL
jgi:hypothetical protein